MLAIDDVVAVSARAAAEEGKEAARRGLVRNGVAGSAQLRLRYEHVAHGVKGSGGEVAGRLLERECAAEPVVELGEEQRLRGAVRASHHRDKRGSAELGRGPRRSQCWGDASGCCSGWLAARCDGEKLVSSHTKSLRSVET